MRWRAFRRLVLVARLGLLLLAVARFILSHTEFRPIYATAVVATVAYNNLYTVVKR